MKTLCPLVILAAMACNGDPTDILPTDGTPDPESPAPLQVTPASDVIGIPGDQFTFTVDGVDDEQAYRITLVTADNITVAADGTATFLDGGSGTADAGPSQDIAGLYSIDGDALDALTKTFPAGTDDPSAPSGIFADTDDDMLTFGVETIDVGTVYPVMYWNGGESTFLEIDSAGVPTEPYVVGPAIEVAPGAIQFDPALASTGRVGDSFAYTLTGLNDTEFYRITLVVDDNVVANAGTGTFTDSGMGTAAAGASEEVALITSAGGVAVDPGAKTVPAGTDDPMNPTGVQPTNGSIDLLITGVGPGTIHPVAYINGGQSTFLEIDATTGIPNEMYAVGPLITVEPELITFDPAIAQTVAVDGTVDYTLGGLDNNGFYRITLVADANITPVASTATFIDSGTGTAAAGPSEQTALITSVGGVAVTPGAKTVPAGTDDPMNPTGIQPINNAITVQVTGVAAGTVYPVAYRNGGVSTFLEIDANGMPIETHAVGAAFTVTAP